ncbi:MAG: hypothetical protein ACUVRA_01455 [Candidatus Bathyarchaeaceae archaeon]
MSKLGRREYYLFNISDKNLESLIDVIKSTLNPPRKYSVDVYPGKYGLNVIIEISGPEEEKIKKIDLEISAKVLEICEKRGIGVHVMGPLEII